MGPNIRNLVLIENLMRQIKILELEIEQLKQGQTMQHRESILSLNNEQLIQYARGEQLKSVMHFIDGGSREEIIKILNEIICCHSPIILRKDHKVLNSYYVSVAYTNVDGEIMLDFVEDIE